ncbi:MAG: repair protein radA protein [Candidatus Magasanikbacteria bacterium GW2011_GWC2_40_17]|uniref:DNA repair protein RadA n=1 Tax=Candidatus Magasanikbacteria bacterium GW2011_GWA2_42_32 TaxID=1619039 RepID=A0A0G1A724_9BACT|nr:MAG: repair protein radA protein [Candidatus Magasanikbacteria bacterium GW2011_GWC2_40_17]KKS56754.1 MAG: repair protein radA protein [Candidatus Magasanikbacteria bacterium GW2011_GWA2_42_32]
MLCILNGLVPVRSNYIMKPQTIYSCSKCDAQYTKWTGRCLECGGWGTIKENSEAAVKISRVKNKKPPVPAGKTLNLNTVIGKETTRLKTEVEEFDRVLGGGFAPGSLTLLGGEPGIGKSTLVLQIASQIKNKSLYVSGEESAEQIKLRFDRLELKPKNLEFLEETNVETICATIEQVRPSLAIIDSIQTISSIEVDGPAGNPTQIKAVCAKLMASAKATHTPIIIIGHVTKEGNLSGPKTLEHLVDTVLYLEGERHHQFRILRAVKNRFGSTNEIGVFEMKQTGLIEVKNPSVAFLSGRNSSIAGSAVTCLVEGSRPLLIEIQALVTRTQFGYPQRRASGFDLNRLQVLIAVLAKRTGLPLETHDIFINVVGGLKADEPAADLAVVLAIASALKNKTLPQDLAAFGEIGLGGELRMVGQVEKRLMEIKKMGFKFVVMPPTKDLPTMSGLKIAPLQNVKEIIEKIIK